MPPFTVASLATTITSLPLTRPMPVIDAGRRGGAVVHAMCRQRRQLEERRTRIEQGADAFARQQLAALGVLRPRLVAAAERGPRHFALQRLDQAVQLRRVGLEFR